MTTWTAPDSVRIWRSGHIHFAGDEPLRALSVYTDATLRQIALHGFYQDNRVNTGSIHGVALVQADGLDQLRQPGGRNRGDAGDPWPGSAGNTLFGPETNPASLDNSGATAGFVVDSIERLTAEGAVRFRLSLTPSGQVLVSLTAAGNQLVGRRSLGSAQLGKLDSLGNHNGKYDTGDFLALYEQQPLAVGGRPR